MSYVAPVKDLLFCMRHLADLEHIAQQHGYGDAGLDTAQAVLDECARFAETVIAPLNKIGDQQNPVWQDGVVRTSPGFKDAFKQYVDGGWQGLQHPVEFGGQHLPKAIGAACGEIFNSANLSFSLCPLLNDGAIEALLTAGSPEQKAFYIPKMISGEWTGTMNLTEPQAGSDLGLITTRAEPQADGSYKLFGTKIFITYGEHDMADNIIHLVLARIVDAPEGVRGISLFIVPKVLADGARNDVRCVSIEHKLGIKASPTAVLQFGDQGGATGYLVGTAHRGLEYMFIMMNAARYSVGVQGVAIAERAYQQAVAYARERVQSRPVDGSKPGSATIIHHPDVRRMLLVMRALTEGCRALALASAAESDIAHGSGDAAQRAQAMALYEFLVPLVKGYATEMSLEVTSLGVQVHGGMGFVEETGAAQHYRDARILTIYEGTTAIQANDLLARKTVRDAGKVAQQLAQRVADTEAALRAHGDPAALRIAQQLAMGRQAFVDVVSFMLAQFKAAPNVAFAGSVPYLMLAGNVMAGWQLGRAWLAAASQLTAGDADVEFLTAKQVTALFYAEHILTRVAGQRVAIISGGDSVNALPMEAY